MYVEVLRLARKYQYAGLYYKFRPGPKKSYYDVLLYKAIKFLKFLILLATTTPFLGLSFSFFLLSLYNNNLANEIQLSYHVVRIRKELI